MCRKATTVLIGSAALLALASLRVLGQTPGLDWRHIGNAAIDLALPSVATGRVDRIWYSSDGSLLYARTASGRVFQTSDFDQWRRVADPSKIDPPPAGAALPVRAPEAGMRLAPQVAAWGRIYGVGRNVFRSDDGGVSWSNLTAYKGVSILGNGLADVAESP